MPELATLGLFALAAGVLIVVPGPNQIYIVTRSLAEGRAAGVASALGVEMGTLVHVGAAAFGLSALIASSATAFNVVRYLGAAYLVFLGVRALLQRDAPAEAPDVARSSHARAFAEGVLVNVLNPKVALFFLAFLPQFVDPSRGAASVQILVLGLVMFSLALVVDVLWGLTAGTLGARFSGSALRRQRRVSGCVYLALGAAAVLSPRARG